MARETDGQCASISLCQNVMCAASFPFRPGLPVRSVAAAALAHPTAPIAPAHAQQAPVAKDPNPAEEAKMQKVEVKGSADTYDPRRDDTASKIVVNHDEIAKYGDT